MTSAPGLVTRLARLRADLARDRDALDARARDAESIAARERGGPLSDADVIVLAVHLHGWYTALETLLERVARLLDESVPEGPTWHADLVAQAAIELPGIRPPVLPPDAEGGLAELRKFRHFFRNAYVLALDPARVLAQARTLAGLHPQVRDGLERLDRHLADTLDEISRG